MKKIFFPITLVLFAAGSILAGCESSAKKVENAEADVADAQAKLDQARLDSVAEYQKSKTAWAAQIAQNEKNIADYKIEVAKEKKEARDRDEEQLDKLEKRNQDMKASQDEYQPDGKQTWHDFKTGMDKVADDFNEDMTEFGKSIAKATDKK